MSKKKLRSTEFADVPTLPDGRYRPAYEIMRYRGGDRWTLERDGVVLGEITRPRGTWIACVSGSTPRVGFMTFDNAREWLSEQCD